MAMAAGVRVPAAAPWARGAAGREEVVRARAAADKVVVAWVAAKLGEVGHREAVAEAAATPTAPQEETLEAVMREEGEWAMAAVAMAAAGAVAGVGAAVLPGVAREVGEEVVVAAVEVLAVLPGVAVAAAKEMAEVAALDSVAAVAEGRVEAGAMAVAATATAVAAELAVSHR